MTAPPPSPGPRGEDFLATRCTPGPGAGDGQRVGTLSQIPERVGDLAARLESRRPQLRRYLCVLGADAATADDLAQEALLVALRRAADLDASEPGRLFGFLRTTARHLWLKDVRRKKSRREVEQADEVWTEECGDDDRDDYMAALRACVGELPERSRDLLQRTYERGCGRAAVAAQLGMSEDGIKSALRRLRQALRRCIERRRTT